VKRELYALHFFLDMVLQILVLLIY
jgi:hypothetical protein